MVCARHGECVFFESVVSAELRVVLAAGFIVRLFYIAPAHDAYRSWYRYTIPYSLRDKTRDRVTTKHPGPRDHPAPCARRVAWSVRWCVWSVESSPATRRAARWPHRGGARRLHDGTSHDSTRASILFRSNYALWYLLLKGVVLVALFGAYLYRRPTLYLSP